MTDQPVVYHEAGYRKAGYQEAGHQEAHPPEESLLVASADAAPPKGGAAACDAVTARALPRANDADRHVGARIRERRVLLGLSQQQLAALIGVTYQQAHKYERGLNRISAGRLYDIAGVLSVPISWFFEGIAAKAGAVEISPRQRMCLELARNFASIENLKHQEALSAMARALAHAEILTAP